MKRSTTQRHAYQRVALGANNAMVHTAHARHMHTPAKQRSPGPNFFHENWHASKGPLGALPTRPCDASWGHPRLPGCVHLGSASQAATGALGSPWPPLLLLLLLLDCCFGWPSETPARAPAQPPPPALAANPTPPPAHTLRPVLPLLTPPWQTPWRPHRSFESPEEAYNEGTQRRQK